MSTLYCRIRYSVIGKWWSALLTWEEDQWPDHGGRGAAAAGMTVNNWGTNCCAPLWSGRHTAGCRGKPVRNCAAPPSPARPCTRLLILIITTSPGTRRLCHDRAHLTIQHYRQQRQHYYNTHLQSTLTALFRIHRFPLPVPSVSFRCRLFSVQYKMHKEC